MQRDLVARKLSELEYLNGTLVAKADAAGIDVPLQRLIVTITRLHTKRGRVGLASCPSCTLVSHGYFTRSLRHRT